MPNPPSNLLLAIDVGNTSIAVGLFESAEKSTLLKTAKIAHGRLGPQYPLRAQILRKVGINRKNVPFDTVISSVVPSMGGKVRKAIENITSDMVIVSSRIDLGITLAVDNPAKLGADRIANAVAAHNGFGKSVAIADCGTATTLSFISCATFLGGAILPGLSMMREAIHEKTARLPLVALNEVTAAIGPDTHTALQSGILLGTTGAVEGIVRRAEQEWGKRFTLVLTGGNAPLLKPLFSRRTIYAADLTLQGLRLIFLRNRKHSAR